MVSRPMIVRLCCALGVLLLVVACGRSSDSAPAVSASASDPSASAPSVNRPPWRFAATLDKHLPDGVTADVVLELSLPNPPQLRLLAAVLRPGPPNRVELELWTFEQGPEGKDLNLLESGRPVLRLWPGPRAEQLDTLRRQLAAPRVVLNRPIGLAAGGPSDLLDCLAKASRTIADSEATPQDRVKAAATLVYGLDDAVVFERDAVWEIRQLLASSGWSMVREQSLSARRHQIVVAQGGIETILELMKKSGGWTIAAVRKEKGAPGGAGAAVVK